MQRLLTIGSHFEDDDDEVVKSLLKFYETRLNKIGFEVKQKSDQIDERGWDAYKFLQICTIWMLTYQSRLGLARLRNIMYRQNVFVDASRIECVLYKKSGSTEDDRDWLVGCEYSENGVKEKIGFTRCFCTNVTRSCDGLHM